MHIELPLSVEMDDCIYGMAGQKVYSIYDKNHRQVCGLIADKKFAKMLIDSFELCRQFGGMISASEKEGSELAGALFLGVNICTKLKKISEM